MEELIAAMHNKEVAGALLDMYAAATKKSMFDGGDIQLNRLIEYPTGYGFVLSGNMAKAAPLFREALASKKTQISRIVEENTDCISQVSVMPIFIHNCHAKFDVNLFALYITKAELNVKKFFKNIYFTIFTILSNLTIKHFASCQVPLKCI